MGPSRSYWNGTTSALQPERLLRRGLEFHVCTINKSAHTKKSGNLFNDPRMSMSTDNNILIEEYDEEIQSLGNKTLLSRLVEK